MNLVLESVIDRSLCAGISTRLEDAQFVDGGATAGRADPSRKRTLQLPLKDPLAREISRDLTRCLSTSPEFVNAVRLKRMIPPRINRYDTGMYYAEHLDNAIMAAPRQALRTDIAVTICLSDAADYEGGELVIQGDTGERRFKGNAGDVIIYPAGSIHEVTEVTRGCRLVAVSWIQSQVREPGQRRILYDLDASLKALEAEGVSHALRLPLIQLRSQLVRMWSDP